MLVGRRNGRRFRQSTEGSDLHQWELGKTALIAGVASRDGAYLAEFLLRQGLHCPRHQTSLLLVQHGSDRSSVSGSARDGDSGSSCTTAIMTDATNLIRIVQETQPDEIYNLAAQSHVQVSFENARIHGQRGWHWARCGCSRRSGSWG